MRNRITFLLAVLGVLVAIASAIFYGRKQTTQPPKFSPATNPYAHGIYANGIANGALPPEDTQYLGQLVAQRTGLSQQDAEKRVTENFQALQTKLKQAETTARDAADKARKASAYTALWLVVSLLIGAFIASFAATLGGRQRDA